MSGLKRATSTSQFCERARARCAQTVRRWGGARARLGAREARGGERETRARARLRERLLERVQDQMERSLHVGGQRHDEPLDLGGAQSRLVAGAGAAEDDERAGRGARGRARARDTV